MIPADISNMLNQREEFVHATAAEIRTEILKFSGPLDDPLKDPTPEGAAALLKLYHLAIGAEKAKDTKLFYYRVGNTHDALKRTPGLVQINFDQIDLDPDDEHAIFEGVIGKIFTEHMQQIEDSPLMSLEDKVRHMLRHHLLGICCLGLHGIERWEPIYATSFEELEQLAPGRRAKIRAPKYENWLRITICDKSFRNPGLFKAWQESLFKDHPEWAPEILTSLVGTMFEETDFEPENYQKMVSCLASGLRQAEVDLDKIAAAYIQAGQPEALLRSRLELE